MSSQSTENDESTACQSSTTSGAAWASGVILCVVGSVMLNVGVNLMKSSHTSEAKFPPHLRRASWKRRRWLLGFLLFGGGNVLNFVALSFAAVSVLSAVGTVQLVSNALIARYMHGEELTKRLLLCNVGIILGVVLVVLFASHSSGCYTVAILEGLFVERPFIIYESVVLVSAAVLALMHYVVSKRLRHDANNTHLYLRQIDALSYALVAAMIGTQSVVLAKCCSELLSTTIQGHNQLGQWLTWVIFIAWAVVMLFWISRLNRALREYEASYIVPVLQCFWTLFSSICGGVYFNEFHKFDARQTAMFVVGDFVIAASVLSMSPRKSSNGTEGGPVDEMERLKIDSDSDAFWTSLDIAPEKPPSLLSKSLNALQSPFRYGKMVDPTGYTGYNRDQTSQSDGSASAHSLERNQSNRSLRSGLLSSSDRHAPSDYLAGTADMSRPAQGQVRTPTPGQPPPLLHHHPQTRAEAHTSPNASPHPTTHHSLAQSIVEGVQSLTSTVASATSSMVGGVGVGVGVGTSTGVHQALLGLKRLGQAKPSAPDELELLSLSQRDDTPSPVLTERRGSTQAPLAQDGTPTHTPPRGSFTHHHHQDPALSAAVDPSSLAIGLHPSSNMDLSVCPSTARGQSAPATPKTALGNSLYRTPSGIGRSVSHDQAHAEAGSSASSTPRLANGIASTLSRSGRSLESGASVEKEKPPLLGDLTERFSADFFMASTLFSPPVTPTAPGQSPGGPAPMTLLA